MSVTIGCQSKDTDACYEIVNLTKDTIAFYNKKTKETYSATIPATTKQNVLLSDSINVAGALSIVSSSNPQTVYVANFPQAGQSVIDVGGSQEIRPSLSKYSNFFFWPIVGVLLIASILCFVFMSKVKQATYQEFCEQHQTDSGIECAELLATQPPSVPNKGLIAGCVIALILAITLIVFWLLAKGPLGNASYSACTKKENYGTVWKWVKPRSGFRKFLCSVFGACECAADTLNEACTNYSAVYESGYAWNEDQAAKSTSSSVCFCCSSQSGTCIDPLTQTPCDS